MDFSKERLLLIVSIFLVITKTLAFHSDELQDDEEWGLVGGRSAEAGFIRPPTISRNKVTQYNSASDSKVQFVLEHAFGDSDFSPAGVFSARLRASPHGGQRCLSGAELEERFIIHMEGVNVIAITYGSTSECSYPRLLKYPIRWSFNSHTVLKSSEQASRMLTMPEDILGGENEGENDEAKKPPERSFWAKYWMYVVPLGLIVMNAITQAMNMPEEQAGGQASTQAGPQRIANSGARRR